MGYSNNNNNNGHKNILYLNSMLYYTFWNFIHLYYDDLISKEACEDCKADITMMKETEDYRESGIWLIPGFVIKWQSQNSGVRISQMALFLLEEALWGGEGVCLPI